MSRAPRRTLLAVSLPAENVKAAMVYLRGLDAVRLRCRTCKKYWKGRKP